ncbi:polysaccharide deacetylase family protein [Rariglobus hedericola]|uniref:Polysaccharide deacetylase family protein n=1 Tax=Rariglobus hedericola TaxID=2597822 RepID=A0A556QN74_9BACT|nr:polysaccharide deacetylase family protein [Rariglobus hedericola]TSJ78100.1 polysaccharide deacetylase family protein [Rariglobus hedericola]
MRFSLLCIVIIKIAALILGLIGVSMGWALVLFFVPDLWVLYHLFMPGASGLVRTFTRFQTDRPEVWLTIDDGPDEHDTPRILDLLDQHGARATFFLVGERAARHPALVAEIARRGHEIGHHTHTHPAGTFWCSTPAQVKRQLDAATGPLTPPGGVPPRCFRPPVGIKNIWLQCALVARGLICVSWNVRSGDSFARDPQKVAEHVLRLAKPGSILLLHEGAPLHDAVRVTAIAQVLAGLDARGLRCVIPADAQLR